MIFLCPKCHEQVCYAKTDHIRFAKRNWICDTCWTPIFHQNYKVNVPGAKVFFSPMGEALGDRIMNSVIRDQYLKDNPDEEITFANYFHEMFDIYRGRKIYDKIFWSNITHLVEPGYPKLVEKAKQFLDNRGKYWIPDKSIWFGVTNEAAAYAGIGIYPTWTEFKKPNIELPQKYAVIHERWIKKVNEKNMEPQIAFALEKWFMENKFYVVLMGNDEPITVEKSPYLIDLRKKLTLPEMAWLLKNSMFFFGKDSGVCHLAGAASDVPLILYGFKSPPWVPKVEPSRLNLFADGMEAIKIFNTFLG